MKTLSIATLLIALPLLCSCVVEEPYSRPPHHSRAGYYAPVSVDVYSEHHDRSDYNHNDWRVRNSGYHCPPGQAKKGNC